MFDWPGNSADLKPKEEVWNIMKNKYFKLPNNKKKKLLNNICNLWYGIYREAVKKRYDEMPSMVEAVPKAKMVMFHFMFVHYTFSSVWVAEWPPLG